MALSPVDSCVRRTPDAFNPYPDPIPPKKTTTDKLNEAVDHLIEGSAVIGRGDTDKQYTNPFDPDGIKISYQNVSINNKGASVGGPAPLFSYIKLGFKFIGEVVPILMGSEPVQAVVKDVVEFVKDTTNTVAKAVQTAVKEVAKVAENVVNKVASWFSSWF